MPSLMEHLGKKDGLARLARDCEIGREGAAVWIEQSLDENTALVRRCPSLATNLNNQPMEEIDILDLKEF